MNEKNTEPEEELVDFNAHAAGYSAAWGIPAVRAAGGRYDAFVRVKVGWLLKDLSRRPVRTSPPGDAENLLDFGCGTGEFLQILRNEGYEGTLEGCDVSEAMLEEAKKRWTQGSIPIFHTVDRNGEGLPPNTYDVVSACCVFHHIPKSARSAVLAVLVRMLKPGGRLVVFEHNPSNPATRWIVKRTPVDRNVTLLPAAEIEDGMASCGLTDIRRRNMLFFPPWFSSLDTVDRLLDRFPLGAQYVLAGEKPS